MKKLFGLLGCVVSALLVLAAVGCGEQNKDAAERDRANEAGPVETEKPAHQPVSSGTGPIAVPDAGDLKVQQFDMNHDNTPDAFKYFRSETDAAGKEKLILVKREIDFNFDTKIDVWSVYENDGLTPAEEKYDLDFDGKVDSVVSYKAGVVEKRMLDMNFDGTMEVTKYYDGTNAQGEENLVRVERDLDRDGRPDQWEYYENGEILKAEEDKDHDGEPDTVLYDATRERIKQQQQASSPAPAQPAPSSPPPGGEGSPAPATPPADAKTPPAKP